MRKSSLVEINKFLQRGEDHFLWFFAPCHTLDPYYTTVNLMLWAPLWHTSFVSCNQSSVSTSIFGDNWLCEEGLLYSHHSKVRPEKTGVFPIWGGEIKSWYHTCKNLANILAMFNYIWKPDFWHNSLCNNLDDHFNQSIFIVSLIIKVLGLWRNQDKKIPHPPKTRDNVTGYSAQSSCR